ncbi:MAG: VWA domain-containing protein [Bryobacteraceae bacterium]
MRPAVLLLLAASTLSAQVTRTEAQSVLVDVLITDKKGAYVPGLTAKDFQVFEDGKEQTIDGLFTEKESATRPSLLLLFDDAAMTAGEQSVARQLAIQFLDQAAAAGDPNIAVLDFGGSLRVSQTFTTDVTRAKQAIARPKSGPLAAGSPTSDFTTRDLLRSLDGLVKNLQQAQGRKSLIFFSPGYVMGGDLTSQLTQIIGAANRSNVSFYPVNVRTSSFNATMVDASAAPVAATGRGRGGPTPTAINSIGASAADPTTANIPSGPALLSILLDLASGTGGFVVRQPDDRATMAKITQEQNEFYVLSYSPPESPDGSCHKLRVKVKRDGVNIRSRESYCKRTPGDLLSGNAAERSLEQRALAAQSGNIPATMQAPYFYKAANVARVTAVLEILPANVIFKKEKNKFTGHLDVLGIANKEDGSAGARFSDVVKFEFDTQAEVDQFKRTPYRYENQFDIAAGDYKLAIALGAGGESFGRLETPLAIQSYAGNEFGLSGIALSHEFRAANQSSSGLDEFLIDDRKKLIADGVEIITAGSSKLSAGKPAVIFVEIYEPLLKSDPQLMVAFQLRVLDRASNAVKADTGMLRLDLSGKQGMTLIPVGLNLPLKDLSPGAYVLEFQVIDSAGKDAKRTALFEIE